MDDARALALIAATEKGGRRVWDMDAAALWRLADALGVALRPTPEGRLLVHGPAAVVRLLSPALARRKRILLAGPCDMCGSDLACAGGRCATCEALRGRTHEYAAGGAAERAFLTALEQAREPETRAPPPADPNEKSSLDTLQ